jgi:hypothetical protein
MDVRNMSFLAGVKHLFKMCGHAFTLTVHERLDALEGEIKALQAAKIVETDAALLQASIHIIENLHALGGRTVVDSSGARSAPDTALLEHIYSHLPTRTACEINASNPEITALTQAGFDVRPLNGNQPIGLATLGGNPMAAIGKMGDRKPSVIAAELEAGFEDLLSEMRKREYYWHLMLYRTQNGSPVSPLTTGTSYLTNHAHSMPDARGRVLFFRDYNVFAEAQAWCAAVLPRTYVKPPQE